MAARSLGGRKSKMKYPIVAIWGALAAFLCSSPGKAEALDVSVALDEAIGAHVRFLKEENVPLSLDEALVAYGAGRYQAATQPILNFGLGSNPVWLGFDAVNPSSGYFGRRFSIETSWLDKIDVYFIRDGRVLESHRLGDTKPFAERPIKSRFFVFDHAFDLGSTTVLMRVETPDPMVVPIYVTSAEEAQSRYTFEAYSYGFIYGALMALLAYNFMLFLSLKNARYIFYSIYLACFMALNIAYTGHGFEWVWPNSPRWQLWSNLVLMVVYSISGLLFATQFLETKLHFPRLHRLVMGSILGISILSAVAIVTGSHFSMVLLAFIFMFLFSPAMVFLGVISVLAGIKYAKYFVIASIAAIIGATLTVLVVWGQIPYSIWAYRAVDIGMMIDAVLLALALADQFRISQEEKNKAERLAQIDPLTGLYNRRAFYELVTPIWRTKARKHHNMAAIILDIDRFKSINDRHGHAFGDDVLIRIAETIKKAARRRDIAARWGGEEFIIILPETDLSEAVFVAERLREQIAETRLRCEDAHVSFTASFGVAHRKENDVTLDDLISAADDHLYRAKKLGRDRVCSRPLG